MNKKLLIMVVIVLIVSLCAAMTGCFGPNVIEQDDPPSTDNNDDQNNDDDNNTPTPNPTPNQYQAIIDDLLDKISGINSMEGYIEAFADLFEEIPVEDITNSVGNVAGEENAALVEEYYNKGMEAIGMLNLVLPMLPYIDTIMQFLNYLDNPVTAPLANGLLAGLGITKNGDVYSYTYEDTVYNVVKNGDVYTISFNNRTIIFEYDLNNYIVTENGIEYDINYDETDIAMSFVVTNIDEEQELYNFQSVNIDNDFAIQIHDVENDRLAQMMTNVELLEINVSLQEEGFVVENILDGTVSEDFAQLGEVFIINEGVVSEFLPEEE